MMHGDTINPLGLRLCCGSDKVEKFLCVGVKEPTMSVLTIKIKKKIDR